MIDNWSDFGPRLAAQRIDVKDEERFAAQRWERRLVSRFTVRASDFTRSIRSTDRLLHDGLTFEIDGIKEAPPGPAFIEITAMTSEMP